VTAETGTVCAVPEMTVETEAAPARASDEGLHVAGGDGRPPHALVAEAQPVATIAGKRTARKPRCEDCFFHQNMLCALPVKKPCPTFRAAHPDGLRPPQQLAFAFRQDRRNTPFEFGPARL
jgi:hypothetical protein